MNEEIGRDDDDDEIRYMIVHDPLSIYTHDKHNNITYSLKKEYDMKKKQCSLATISELQFYSTKINVYSYTYYE